MHKITAQIVRVCMRKYRRIEAVEFTVATTDSIFNVLTNWLHLEIILTQHHKALPLRL